MDVSMNRHPVAHEDDGKLLEISPTTDSLASHVGKLVTTKSGLASANAVKPEADCRTVELEIPAVSACFMNVEMFASFISYTVNCMFDNSSSLCFAKLSAICIPMLPSPTKDTFTVEEDDEVLTSR